MNELYISKIHPESRNEGRIVGDGQFGLDLLKGEEITITSSRYDVLSKQT